MKENKKESTFSKFIKALKSSPARKYAEKDQDEKDKNMEDSVRFKKVFKKDTAKEILKRKKD